MFPTSVTSFKITLVGTLSAIIGVGCLAHHPLASPGYSILILMLCWTLPILILEAIFLPHVRRAITQRPQQLDVKLATLRYLGLALTLSVIALILWVCPEYSSNFYVPWWSFLKLTVPALLLLAWPYFLWMGQNIPQEQDAYYQLGLLVLGQTRQLNKPYIIQHILGWTVKLFFLPLMIGYVWASLQGVEKFTLHELIDSLLYCFHHLLHPGSIEHVSHFLSANFMYVFNFAWVLIFLLDAAIVALGYSLTLRLFDNNIRSTEPTLMGWAVALICYSPFSDIIGNSYFSLGRSDYTWGTWLYPHDIAYVIWGCIILMLISVYVSASIIFGLRFSNLTNRGIITNGPYRWVKHPAYLSKNLAWWLVCVPFIASTTHYSDAIRNVIWMVAVNVVYYLRAKTEEKHLSTDPAYRAYLTAIANDGLAAKMKKWFLPARIATSPSAQAD